MSEETLSDKIFECYGDERLKVEDVKEFIKRSKSKKFCYACDKKKCICRQKDYVVRVEEIDKLAGEDLK